MHRRDPLWDDRVMDDDRRFTVPGAKLIPIRVAGEWDGLDWQGLLSAEEELAGVLLVRAGEVITWTRSRRSGPDGLSLKFRIGSEPAGPENWFSVELGGEFCWGRVASELINALPRADLEPHSMSGQITWLPFSAVIGWPLQIGVLALARSDVRFGRKRIWRLKPGLRESLDNDLRLILVSRRHGLISA